ncbi:hypothetical protein [Marinospirillum sp.]|uniref:hypothetical protein n=1 Tax=Marinospirillum sp. TaxID=2183934 RepID=UPI003A8389AB
MPNQQTQQRARVIRYQALNQDVYHLVLAPEEPIEFQAGQYIELQAAAEQWGAFSLASAPGAPHLELHIQHLPERPTSALLHQLCLRASQEEGFITLRGPQGGAVLPDSRPEHLRLIAAGTGYAQMKSILLRLDQQAPEQAITLYWAVRTSTDFYDLQWLQHWQQAPQHQLIQVVELADAHWTGRTGRITEALAQDLIQPDSAADWQGLLSGSPAMVYAVEDFLIERGLTPGALISDVHFYAPRHTSA